MDSELKKIWGFHALFDCAACDIERVKSKANVCDFLAEMVREIDMVPFGAPYIERFATHDVDKSGISFFQMIEFFRYWQQQVFIIGVHFVPEWDCSSNTWYR